MRSRNCSALHRNSNESAAHLQRAAATAGVVVQARVVLRKVVIVHRDLTAITRLVCAGVGCRRRWGHRPEKGHGDNDRPDKGGQESPAAIQRHRFKG